MARLTEEEIQKLTAQMEKSTAAFNTARTALLGLTQGEADYEKQLESTLQRKLKAEQATLALARAEGATAEQIEALRAGVRESNLELKAHKEKLESAAEALKNYEKQAAAGYSATKQLAAQVGLMGEDWKNASGSIMLTTGGIKGAFKALREVLNPINLVGSAINAMAEGSIALTLALDQGSVAFNKQTGMLGRYDDIIVDSTDKMHQMGVFTADLYRNMGLLSTEIGTFTNLSDTQAQSMMEGISLLEKYGISANQTVEPIGSMSAAMGITEDQAMDMQLALFNAAIENDISTTKMMSDWAQTADAMMAFGDRAGEVFRDLAVAAESANMSTAKLLGIATRFDTFDEATKSVGKLNALLGGPYLNSLEMVMETDPTRRLSMLQSALTATGQTFQDLSYYEAKALADAAGLENTADLAKIMSGEFENLSGTLGMSEEELAKLEAKNTEFNTVMEEAKALLMEFAIAMKPVLDFAKGLMERFQNLSPTAKKLVFGLAAAAIAMKVVGAAGGGMMDMTISLVKALVMLVVGLTMLPVLFTTLGPMLLLMVPLFLGLAGAIATAASAAGLLGAGLGALETPRAVALTTTFEDAPALAATRTINNAANTGATQRAAAASPARQLVAAPIDNNITLVLEGRELAKFVHRNEAAMKILGEGAGGGAALV